MTVPQTEKFTDYPMASLNILVVTEAYPSHDRPYQMCFAHKRVKQLLKYGCRAQVFCPRSITLGTYLRALKEAAGFFKTPKNSSYNWDGISIHSMRYHSFLPSKIHSRTNSHLAYRAIKPKLLKLHREYGFNLFDLVHATPLCLAASRIAKELGLYCVQDVGMSDIDSYYRDPQSCRFKLQREIMLACDLVVCVSDHTNQMMKLMADGHVQTVTHYAGVDPAMYRKDVKLRDVYRRKLCYTPTEIVLLLVGHLIKRKGVYELIEVFTDLSKEYTNLRLLLLGELLEKTRVLRAIKASGMESCITIVGGVPPDQVPGYMNAADLFVFPSHSEGLPNAVMEACACEMPVIASNVGGVAEIIDDGISGLLVKPTDKADLCRKIRPLLESPQARKVLGKKAREIILKRFDYNNNGQALVRKLESIVRES